MTNIAFDHNVLVVDDMRIPKRDHWKLVTTPDEALDILTDNQSWDIICLDHDLGGDLTIRPVIDHIVQNSRKFRETIFYIISSNPVGVDMMRQALSAKKLLAIPLTEDQKGLLFEFRSWEEMTGY